MDDKERWDELCKPAFEKLRKDMDAVKALHPAVKTISEDVAALKKHLITGNGTPSLLARVGTLEGASKHAPADGRSVKVGKLIELRGYGLNDVTRAAILLGIAWLLYLNISERMARNGIAIDLRKTRQTTAVVAGATTP